MVEDSFAAGLIGITLDDRYRLDALLGEGGMGAVFRATQLANERKVAVKLLKPHLTNDDAALERFAREARSTMRVDSPHAVKVLDFGITPGGPRRDYYMVLEYLDGRTAQRELEVDGPFAAARVLHIAKHACIALAAAHREGLVHRDIKPDNLLLMRVGDDPDYLKVLDFGVAKLMDGAARSDRSALALTQRGMVFGTPELMSPEQACGHALDGRSDLYSLAATMFVLLTGKAVFAAKTPIEWLTHHVRTPAPHLADAAPELADLQALDLLLQRCLAKHRESRPANAEQMIEMLDAIEHGVGSVAAAEVALEDRAAAASTRGKPSVHRASTYVEALPAESLAEPANVKTGGRRMGAMLAIGAIAIVAVVAVAIAMMMAKRGPSGPQQAANVAEPVQPLPLPLPQPQPSPQPLPLPQPLPQPQAQPLPPAVSARARELATHIGAAKEAKQAGNSLRQIAEADAALRIDSHNVLAKVLIADGLIASGSTESGCKYLRGLTAAPAHALAQSAHCPSD